MSETNSDLDKIDGSAIVNPANGASRLPKDDAFVPEPSSGFVTTPFVENITQRALTYLQAGYPVHFSGPAGTGKTTLCLLYTSPSPRD